ncbi:hypothetical protein VTN49DRAFT_4468 [Thermomyces lanuginosus]|uniref:uncharacterized protein n=1 Tax=Thermomyces lanuginosus TaxID=5541 RepID=UPI0037437EC0
MSVSIGQWLLETVMDSDIQYEAIWPSPVWNTLPGKIHCARDGVGSVPQIPADKKPSGITSLPKSGLAPSQLLGSGPHWGTTWSAQRDLPNHQWGLSPIQFREWLSLAYASALFLGDLGIAALQLGKTLSTGTNSLPASPPKRILFVR